MLKKSVMLNAGKHFARVVGVSDPSGAGEMLPGVQHDVLLAIFKTDNYWPNRWASARLNTPLGFEMP